MSTQVRSEVPEPVQKSPYCADPDCIFCKELREVYEVLSRGKTPPSSGQRPA
jgi:hypothetical protein